MWMKVWQMSRKASWPFFHNIFAINMPSLKLPKDMPWCSFISSENGMAVTSSPFNIANPDAFLQSTDVLVKKESAWEAAWNHLWNHEDSTKTKGQFSLQLLAIDKLTSSSGCCLSCKASSCHHWSCLTRYDWFPPRSKVRHALTHPTHPAWSHWFVCQLSNSPLRNLLPVASCVETWRTLWTFFGRHRPIKRDPPSKTSYSIYATLERSKSWKIAQNAKLRRFRKLRKVRRLRCNTKGRHHVYMLLRLSQVTLQKGRTAYPGGPVSWSRSDLCFQSSWVRI